MPSVDPEPPSLDLLLDVDDDAFADRRYPFQPDHAFLHDWACHALSGVHEFHQAGSNAELSVRLVSRVAMQALNREWRDRDAPTNVLSFPSGLPLLPSDVGLRVLGDLALCPSVVDAEAEAQGKTPGAHWAHMVVHGVLHLCGLDHEDERDADAMEALETRLLAERDVSDPYATDTTEVVSS